MATRYIGVDSTDPRLPDGVIEATQGLTAADLAAGDTLAQANAYTDSALVGAGVNSFVGTFSTAAAPAASSVPTGYYYWDLNQAQPFWSDGAEWRDAGSSSAPPPDPDSTGVALTIDAAASSISPEITLRSGSTATIEWSDSDDVVLTTGLNPTILRPTDGIVVMRAVSGSATVMGDIEVINLGFDNTQDAGIDNIGSSYDYPAQQVTAITGLSLCNNLRYFCAANGPLTGEVDFSDLADLEHIECYNANITSVVIDGCTSLKRLCLEQNAITNLDLTPVAATLKDLRCAGGSGGVVTFSSSATLPVLWHYCTRGQTVATHIPNNRMPAVEQLWVYDTGITTYDPPISAVLRSVLMNGNALTSATIDAFLIALAAGPVSNGAIRATSSFAPTPSSDAARATLLARGWEVSVPASSGGGGGEEPPPEAHGPFVSGDLTHLDYSGTPSVTSGVLTATSATYARSLWRPGGRHAGDCVLEVSVDRAEINGDTGTDFWALMVNCDNSGNGGLRAMIRWPQVTDGGSTGVGFAASDGAFGSAGTTTRLAPFPAGWTDAGQHTIGLRHYGAEAVIVCDGTDIWRCTSATIEGYAAGGYVGIGGNSHSTARVWTTWGFTERFVKPDATNTGSTGGTLTAMTAAAVEAAMSNGAVIENVAISGGTVDLGSFNNVTIRNFTFDADGDIYAFRVNGTGRGLILEDGEIYGMSSSAVLGPAFTARRLNIHNSGNDAFKPQPSGSATTGDVLVESCYLHVLGTAVDAHGDGCQVQALHTYNMVFRGNNFDLPRDILPGSVHTSCFLLDEASGSTGTIRIEQNWLNGGQATIYAGVPNHISVIKNRFGRDYGATLVSEPPCEVWTNNIWEDDGTVAVQPT